MEEGFGGNPYGEDIGVRPGIAPTEWSVSQAELGDGTLCTMITFYTPVGSTHLFFPADSAVELGKTIQKVAGMTAVGLRMPRDTNGGF